jgi:hypothetical protein
MFAYWSRVLAAWLLLRFASQVLKDAEEFLKETMQAKSVRKSDATDS